MSFARRRHLLFLMTGAATVPGGIASVNMSVLHTLVRIVRRERLSLTVFSLLETPGDRVRFLPAGAAFRGFVGDRLAFARAILGFVVRKPLYLFERVGLAVPILPVAHVGLAKTVIFAHGTENWRDVRRRDRASLQSAWLVVTNSDYTLRRMQQSLARFRGVSCPLGLPPQFKLNREVPAAADRACVLEAADGRTRLLGDRVLLLVGRMDPREREKGHFHLLDVFPELRQAFPTVQLVLAGPGDDRTVFREIAVRKEVGDAVFLPGYLPVPVLENLYRRCYAFVMPSRQEGFGLVYLEAMNFAKPCVGSWGDGAEDVIVHEQTGLLLRDSTDRRELLASLERLLACPAFAEGLGKAGFRRLHAGFSTAHYQARLEALLLPVIGVSG